MQSICKPIVAGILLLMGSAGLAHAAATATNNQCWGDILSQFAQSSAGAVGQHSSASGTFTPDPGDGGRLGVGNVSMQFHGGDLEGGQALANGAQGNHAIANGALFGGPGLPAGSIEANTAPIVCDGTPGNPGPAIP